MIFKLIKSITVLSIVCFLLTIVVYAQSDDQKVVTVQSGIVPTPSPDLSNKIAPTPTPQPQYFPMSTPIPENNVNYGKQTVDKTQQANALDTPSINGAVINSNSISWSVVFPVSGHFSNRLQYYSPVSGLTPISISNTLNGTYITTNLAPGYYMGEMNYNVFFYLQKWVTISPLGTPALTKVSSTSNSITWRAVYEVSGQTNNKLELYNSASGWSVISADKAVNGDYVSANLQPNTSYIGRLTYYNFLTSTYYTKDLTVTTTNILSEPLNLRAELVNTTTARLSWDEPISTRGLAISYQVYSGSTLIGTTNQKYFDFTSNPSLSYSLTVKATDSSGSSNASAALIKKFVPKYVYTYQNGRLMTILMPGKIIHYSYDKKGNLKGKTFEIIP